MKTHTIRHEHSVAVEASAQAAWQLASDISRYPEWVGATLAVLDPSPAEALPGATYRERTRVAGPIRTTSTWTVVERNDGALFQRHHCLDESGPVRSMWIEMTVASTSSTVFTTTIGCEVAAGPLTRPLGRLLSRRLGADNARNVQRFAALLSSTEPTAARLETE